MLRALFNYSPFKKQHLTKRLSLLIMMVFTSLLVSGCSTSSKSKSDEEVIAINYTSSDFTNPDLNQRSSPVYIYVYAVFDEDRFLSSDYYSLTTDESFSKNSLLTVDRFIIAPNQTLSKEYKISKKVKNLGIVAGFRDLENSQWRVMISDLNPKKSFTSKVFSKDQSINVMIDKQAISYDIQ